MNPFFLLIIQRNSNWHLFQYLIFLLYLASREFATFVSDSKLNVSFGLVLSDTFKDIIFIDYYEGHFLESIFFPIICFYPKNLLNNQ